MTSERRRRLVRVALRGVRTGIAWAVVYVGAMFGLALCAVAVLETVAVSPLLGLLLLLFLIFVSMAVLGACLECKEQIERDRRGF